MHLEIFRKDTAVVAAIFNPDFAILPPLAALVVDAFVGEHELTESEVPAGPALRVRRNRKVDPGKRRSKVSEVRLLAGEQGAILFTQRDLQSLPVRYHHALSCEMFLA